MLPVLGRQRQADLCEFKASLVFRVSSRTTGQRNRVSKQPRCGAGEVAQQLNIVALPEDLGSVPAPTLGISQVPLAPAPENLMPSPGLLGNPDSVHIYTHL